MLAARNPLTSPTIHQAMSSAARTTCRPNSSGGIRNASTTASGGMLRPMLGPLQAQANLRTQSDSLLTARLTGMRGLSTTTGSPSAMTARPGRKEMLKASNRRPSFSIDLPIARGFHSATPALEERFTSLSLGPSSTEGGEFASLKDRVPTPYPKNGAAVLWGSDSVDGAMHDSARTVTGGDSMVEHDYLPKVWEDTC